ncbi:hypothetical protein [Oryza sativa Japonica Group]|uniref:Uncharacterized protein P0031D11.10 n=1 Tax=Oryza sativa subsp. japonica TaxID=39947 RepID=Q5NA14_ORYSJ|nr:hypothetical protein [Oryza sativa Japonica Group]
MGHRWRQSEGGSRRRLDGRAWAASHAMAGRRNQRQHGREEEVVATIRVRQGECGGACGGRGEATERCRLGDGWGKESALGIFG